MTLVYIDSVGGHRCLPFEATGDRRFFVLLDEPPFYGHRGPRVEHDVTLAAFPVTEEPEPSPREAAKARALAVFGPKRGRWA